MKVITALGEALLVLTLFLLFAVPFYVMGKVSVSQSSAPIVATAPIK